MDNTSTTSAFIFNRFHILRDQSLINIIISRKNITINISDIFSSFSVGHTRTDGIMLTSAESMPRETDFSTVKTDQKLQLIYPGWSLYI